MKLIIALILLLQSFTAFSGKPLRILVITGGHDYNHETFSNMFSSFKGATFRIAAFPEAFSMFLPENRNSYDVLVFYHMWKNITTEQEKALRECIAEGKPLVVLHHSICAFDGWDEYRQITGGKYLYKTEVIDGKTYEPSTYRHDVNIPVRIAKNHPVTRGVSDFEIFDETYGNYYVSPKAEPLLVTSELTSTPVIGWVHRYGKARVVTLQSGHDTPAYNHPIYRKLLWQAITWVYHGK